MSYDYKYDWQHVAQRKANKGFKVKTYETDNAQYAKTDVNFRACCDKAGVEPTSRQASKFRNRKGKAFNHGQL